MVNPSKNTYDPEKNYTKVKFIEQRSPLDFELNEEQDIKQGEVERLSNSIFGTSAIGDAFKIVPSSNQNEFVVLPGIFYHEGHELNLWAATPVTIVSGTPPIGQNLLIYCDYWTQEIDYGTGPDEDPDIIDPNIGTETAVREKTKIEFGSVVGTIIPPPITGRTRFRFAQIYRDAGDPYVQSYNITDERGLLEQTYVETGLDSQIGGVPLTVQILPGTFRVQGNRVVRYGSTITCSPNSTVYVWYSSTGVIFAGSSLPISTIVLLVVKIICGPTSVTDIIDLRQFASKIKQASVDVFRSKGTQSTLEDWTLVQHNADGTHKPFTSTGDFFIFQIADLRVDETSPSSRSVYIREGYFPRKDGYGVSWFAGATSSVIPPTAHDYRIDLICLSDGGVVTVVQGSTLYVSNPQPDPYPVDKWVLAEVTVGSNPLASIIKANIKDTRSFVLGNSRCCSGSGSDQVLYQTNITLTGFSTSFTGGDRPIDFAGKVVSFSVRVDWGTFPADPTKIVTANLKRKNATSPIEVLGTVSIPCNTIIGSIVLNKRVYPNDWIYVEGITPYPLMKLGFAARLVLDTSVGQETAVIDETHTVSSSLETDFRLNQGSYTPGNHSLQVFRNGKELQSGVEFFEISFVDVKLNLSTEEDDLIRFKVLSRRSDCRGADGRYAPFLYEVFIAVSGQTIFKLKTGYYVPNTGELKITRNGKVLASVGEFREVDSVTIELISPAEVGDIIIARVC